MSLYNFKQEKALEQTIYCLNLVVLSSILLLLLITFVIQLVLHDLPCPLCFLQRLGFLGAALGFVLNLRFGPHPSHYAIVIISSLYTGFEALQHISFHILPETGVYGPLVLGLHLYTWSAIIALLIMVASVFLLSLDKQYQFIKINKPYFPRLTMLAFMVLTLLTAANVLTVLLECGISLCPSHPLYYSFVNFG